VTAIEGAPIVRSTELDRPPIGPRTVAMIWAQARNGVIGAFGGLPWHLPEDLKLFRALTTGSTVVMGRRTWDSLPERFRPLPGRTNVVLTSDPGWSAEGARRAASVADVLAAADGPLWVIGGGAVYAAFLPYADRLVITDVDVLVEGDTWAPALGNGWQQVSRTPDDGWSVSSSGLRYAVAEYVRGTVAPAG
jgi:dihydrofolate reductase